MELERRYSVLAVSASLKFVETLRTLLPEGRYGPVTVCLLYTSPSPRDA